mmetsp:Transcript_5920/g.16916  ORF Transcript_5920/g.16916 Transcript_5920/m.16916 type:complete len:317 (-) Transcript_5920:2397-3347(-)
MASVAAKQAPSDRTDTPPATNAAASAVGDTREIRELRVLLQKSQAATNNALRRCEQLTREKGAALETAANANREGDVLRRSLGVAEQVMAAETRKLEAMARDRDRAGEEAAHQAQRATAAEARCSQMGKEAAEGALQRRRLEDTLRSSTLNEKGLQQEIFALKANAADVAVLKQDVVGLEADLALERGKARALAEEVERPLNVHRWRHLEGSDPAAHEMLLQIQCLQRRLIAVTEAGVEKGLQIQERDAELAQLRQQLATRPGPELLQQLCHAQADVASKSKQVKALTAELQMHASMLAPHSGGNSSFRTGCSGSI